MKKLEPKSSGRSSKFEKFFTHYGAGCWVVVHVPTRNMTSPMEGAAVLFCSVLLDGVGNGFHQGLFQSVNLFLSPLVISHLKRFHQCSVCDPQLEIWDEVHESNPVNPLKDCSDPVRIQSPGRFLEHSNNHSQITFN
jgi:hypothetical protein